MYQNEVCVICHERLIYTDTCVLNCNHRFHLSCFLKWKKRNCPLCRENYQMLFDPDYNNLEKWMVFLFIFFIFFNVIAIIIYNNCRK